MSKSKTIAITFDKPVKIVINPTWKGRLSLFKQVLNNKSIVIESPFFTFSLMKGGEE